MMPAQKPGQSKQDYQTPKELLLAIQKRLGIKNFGLDVAASRANAICQNFYDEDSNALACYNHWRVDHGGWAWCNPPYANIDPWVSKAKAEAVLGAHVCMLVPAAVGANWWRDHVENHAYVLHLNGRVIFVGCKDTYPKDCSVLLYVPWRATGSQTWSWREVV